MVKEKWNGRYATEGAKWQASRPRDLLLTYLDRLPETGLALDAASGVGVNGRLLARRGWRVLALDISEVGLRLGRAQALKEGLGERWLTAVYDLSRPHFPPNCFDAILNFRFLERATFPAYRQALKPGGWLIFETFIRDDEAAPDAEYYLRPGELPAAFADFVVVESGEITAVGGRSGQEKRVARLVARKPDC
jgi:tellurite methyltransferase